VTLPTRTLLAMLEEAGYRRRAIRRMTRRYVRDVMQHPRDRDGRLEVPSAPRRSPAAVLADLLRARKMPEWLIALKVREDAQARAGPAIAKKPPGGKRRKR
jgi:hypothetical protein